MKSDAGGEVEKTLAPDDAFAVLGNGTRMEILQALAETDDPMSFSGLYEQVDVHDTGQFNYHFDQLTDHFVRRTDRGYELQRAGERVIEAIVSGAVTEHSVIEPTPVEWPCYRCGAPTTMSYQQEWVALSCTECPGIYGGESVEDERAPNEQLDHGYNGGLSLPSAALEGRTPSEVLRAAWHWDALERLALATGTCPRCSAAVEYSIHICQDHDAADGPCEECGTHRMLTKETTCPNCPFAVRGSLVNAFIANTDLIAFLTAHGYNPITPTADYARMMRDHEEELLSTDPFQAQFTWTIDGDNISITVDEDVNVVAVERERDSGTK